MSKKSIPSYCRAVFHHITCTTVYPHTSWWIFGMFIVFKSCCFFFFKVHTELLISRTENLHRYLSCLPFSYYPKPLLVSFLNLTFIYLCVLPSFSSFLWYPSLSNPNFYWNPHPCNTADSWRKFSKAEYLLALSSSFFS